MSSSSSWLSAGAKWARDVTGYTTADDAGERNEAELQRLNTQYANALRMIESYNKNAIYHASNGDKNLARAAMARKKDAQNRAHLLAGKIATLESINSNMRSMQSNLEMTTSIEKSNVAMARMGGKLQVERVEDVMEAAIAHKEDHMDVSRALSGDAYLDPIDEDEADAELDALMNKVKSDPFHPVNAPPMQDVPAPDIRAPSRETPAQKAAREEEVLRRAARTEAILADMPPAPTRDLRRPLPKAMPK